jgi:PPE-repeat protein
MDFGMMPPEITSTLIHTGPGAWSWLDAAGMWQELSAELEAAASGYTSVLSSLTADWGGPSSLAMAQAAQPYLAWLHATAQQAQEVAASIDVATAAFELTHWTVVHPSVVAANRARLAMLVATNFFGINLPAIAETEAEYNAMWVNNSAAMYRYAATSLGALKLPRFSSPPTTTNPAGQSVQANAVSNAAGTSAGSVGPKVQAAVSNLATTQDAAGIFGPGGDPNKGWFGYFSAWGNQTIAGGLPINLLSYLAQLSTAQALQGVGGDIAQGLSEGTAALAASETRLISALGAAGSGLAPRGAFGVSILVGKLSMPPAAVGMLPGVQAPVQLASAVTPLPSGGSALPGLPVAPMRSPAGGKGGRRGGGRDYDDIEYGAELPGTVMNRPPSAG